MATVLAPQIHLLFQFANVPPTTMAPIAASVLLDILATPVARPR